MDAEAVQGVGAAALARGLTAITNDTAFFVQCIAHEIVDLPCNLAHGARVGIVIAYVKFRE